jgi:hypothetical protein
LSRGGRKHTQGDIEFDQWQEKPMLLTEGDKLLVVHRRLFADDNPRFFVGVVSAYEGGVARTVGYSFMRDIATGKVARKKDPRTKIVSVASGTLLVYQLPTGVEVESVDIVAQGQDLVLTDHRQFKLDLSEWGHTSSR